MEPLPSDLLVEFCVQSESWRVWPLVCKRFQHVFQDPGLWQLLMRRYFPEEQNRSPDHFRRLWADDPYTCSAVEIDRQLTCNTWLLEKSHVRFWRKPDRLDPVPGDRLRGIARQQAMVKRLRMKESQLPREARDARLAIQILIEDLLTEEEEIYSSLKHYLRVYYKVSNIDSLSIHREHQRSNLFSTLLPPL